MRKIMIYQKRRSDSDRQGFFQSVLSEQPPLLKQMPALRRLVVSLETEGKDETFDAVTELVFDDANAAAGGLGSEGGERALAAMRANASRLERVDLVPHALFNTGQPAPFKLVVGLKRRADLTRGDFKQVNLVEDGPEAFVDGTAEVCFADLATLQRIMSSAHVKDVQQDSQVHTQARYRFFVEEHDVLGKR